ncbi:putative high affinity immunoglobulin gamma Fc receptor IB isoform X1 [Amphiprion ocellaris]|uniref:Ig-like domain-containing protein n=2 Tax=Amphiprion ocellaris TaxID=80972 RepID=A0AAQ5YR09_AMPOC|nr:putative high affinity immunoglobulin gamma Fc receptor IB isoform X1 [Amphiprion ocellaris]XP_054863840.1 putative high affinity immunoglobulin gamma Fc receptor IB isoform X1 [Amphiprion ocellaris]
MMILFLLLLMRCCRTSSNASMVVEPSRSQFFEYEKFSLSCEQFGPRDWTVRRYTTSGLDLSQCGGVWGSQKSSTCHMNTVKASNTGVYWCESKNGDSSDGVNITITEKPVILQSPALPVKEGGNVTLGCRTKGTSSVEAQFYKDGALIGSGPAGHMTIHHVSKEYEGAYKCSIQGHGESPLSWLLVEDGSGSASLTVSPQSSQMFEYQYLDLNCGPNSSFHGWTVHRSTELVSTISSCGRPWGSVTASGCILKTAKQTDSGYYWCESLTKRRSNSVNLTVHDKEVMLVIPVLPVMKGDNVTLSCHSRSSTSLPSDFYKDEVLIGINYSGSMTIFHVSKSDEGIYRCEISGHGESLSSWLFVRGSDEGGPQEVLSVVTVIRCLVVGCPYVISTVLMASLYRQQPTESEPIRRRNLPVSMAMSSRGQEDEELNEQYDDVMAAVTTEHHF